MQLFNRAPRLVYRFISISSGSRVRICNSNPSKAFAPNLAWTVTLGPFRVEQVVVFVSIAVRPAVHGDRRNIIRWIESTLAKHSRKLIANVSLERFKRCGQQIAAARAMLIALWQTWQARSAFHTN